MLGCAQISDHAKPPAPELLAYWHVHQAPGTGPTCRGSDHRQCLLPRHLLDRPWARAWAMVWGGAHKTKWCTLNI